MYGADALGAEGTLDNNFQLRKRRACATYGNRAAKWTATKSSETLYFNTMWTWHTDTGLPEGQYSKHIYLGETRVVTKQTSKLEASYGQSDEWHHQYYYHPDHLGSAQLVTDFEGNEYQRIEYTPYGELWVEKKTEKEEGLRYLPYKFTAKEQDEETGLYYYGARYLDAKYSRWLSADPAVGEYIPQAPISDEAKKHNEKLPGMGGVFNVVNFQLYHYAGNNPLKYVDPDGKFTWAAIPFIIGIGLLFKTDTQPKATPINADAINNKLANIYYNDPSKLRGVFLSSPYTRENSESLTLESHPIVAFGCALPRGNYSESDYSNQNQMKDTRIEKTRTVLDGLNLASSIIQKLSDGHVGDITLTYKKGWGKITSWTLTLTTLDPVSGRSTGRQVFSREDALKYLNDNKEILKNDPAYKELKILLD